MVQVHCNSHDACKDQLFRLLLARSDFLDIQARSQTMPQSRLQNNSCQDMSDFLPRPIFPTSCPKPRAVLPNTGCKEVLVFDVCLCQGMALIRFVEPYPDLPEYQKLEQSHIKQGFQAVILLVTRKSCSMSHVMSEFMDKEIIKCLLTINQA